MLTLSTPDGSLAAAALAYARRGWHVLPLYPVADGLCGCGVPGCATPGKHPIGALVPRGLHNASAFPAHLERWWQQWPDANIGIRTGAASRLLVIDVDDRPHDGRDGAASWRRLLADHAGGVEPSTVEASTGGGGRHLFFLLPDGLALSSSRDVLGPGLEVKAEGGYVVAAPSRHVSGRDYDWDASYHPDDRPPAPLPDWLRALCTVRIPRAASGPRLTITLAPLEVAELTSALAAIPSDERDTWLAVGMALHATGDDDAGRRLWDTWSQTSDKFDAADQERTWRAFTDRLDGRTVATVFHLAHHRGWQRPALDALARSAGIALPTLGPPTVAPVRQAPAAVPVPIDPLTVPLPGHLELLAGWSLDTASHPVRAYATSAALALGSVLAARRYVTDGRNYSSLYFLVIGKSGTGKEHVRTTIETVARAIDAPELLGPGRFTSASAVFSGLLTAPQQIAVLDEFGKTLEAASSSSGDMAGLQDGMLTELMELYGRLHATHGAPQFSTLSLSSRQAESYVRKQIERPGLTLIALATPATFYGALRSARIASGFLNRFCALDAGEVPRGDFAMPSAAPPPDAVLDWARALVAPRGDLDRLNRLTELPAPTRLQFTPEALALLRACRRDCNRLADQLESEALGELPMRTAEQAMRLALIATLAESAEARQIGPDAAAWGVDVSRWMLDRLLTAVRRHMSENPLHRLRQAFLGAVERAGERGLTQREILRGTVFVGTTRRDRDDVVAWAVEAGHAAWTIVAHGPDGGRPRRALVSASSVMGEEAVSA
jgi:hypothetical protein